MGNLLRLQTEVVKLDNKDWELRVLSSAYESMEQEIGKWPDVETGGLLIGRLCIARKCAIVTRILEAPPDSILGKVVCLCWELMDCETKSPIF